MKYRTKLHLFFVGISCATVIAGVSFTIYTSHSALFKNIANQSVSIAATAATNIDGDLVEQIKVKEDEKKPAYQELRNYLRKVRNTNRNANIYVKYIYTIYPDPKDPTKFLFGVDAEESQESVSHAGTDNPGATIDLLHEHISEPYSYEKLVKDPWGTWLTGYAPIYNSKGEYVGTLGVDISANFVAKVMRQLYIKGLIAFVGSILLAIIAASLLSRKLSTSLSQIDEAAKEFGAGNFVHQIDLNTHDEFQNVADSLNKMADDLKEKERMKIGFAHYVSSHIMEQISKSGAPTLGGERKKITVFFCDIVNFTQMAEEMPPEDLMTLLNEYFEVMIEIIYKNKGMLDKLIGDAIMAEFGFPVDDPEQEKNAVLTALEMQSSLAILRKKWKMGGKPEIQIGIGIHTGEAVIGIVGSKERVQFTAVGDTVNTASRLERLTRDFNEQIIISEDTYKALNDQFQVKPLGAVELSGKSKTINAYGVERLS